MGKLVLRRSEFLRPLEDMMDEVVNHFNDDFFASPARLLEGMRHKAYPKINIRQSDNSLIVEASVPGMKEEDLKVTLEEDLLTIAGKKKATSGNTADDSFYIRELSMSEFSRSIKLNRAIVGNTINASLNDGILKLVLPLQEDRNTSNVKEIKINK